MNILDIKFKVIDEIVLIFLFYIGLEKKEII